MNCDCLLILERGFASIVFIVNLDFATECLAHKLLSHNGSSLLSVVHIQGIYGNKNLNNAVLSNFLTMTKNLWLCINHIDWYWETHSTIPSLLLTCHKMNVRTCFVVLMKSQNKISFFSLYIPHCNRSFEIYTRFLFLRRAYYCLNTFNKI